MTASANVTGSNTIESIPVAVIRQIALLLLCGLCRSIVTINASVAYMLINLTDFEALLYIGARGSPYDCLFQTPRSVLLRS